LTGARAGREIEPRNQAPFGSAHAVLTAEGNTRDDRTSAMVGPGSPRSKAPSMYGTSARGSWEIPSTATTDGSWSAKRSPIQGEQR
jgi:hypothetical protein